MTVERVELCTAKACIAAAIRLHLEERIAVDSSRFARSEHHAAMCCRGLAFFFCCLPAVFAAGCSGSGPKTEEAELNLRRIVQAYQLASEPHGNPPRDLESITRFFKELGDPREPDKILRSPRDGQPYVILFGAKLEWGDGTILAYERDGKDGARYVATLSRDVKILNDAEFAQAQFVGGHKPATANAASPK